MKTLKKNAYKTWLAAAASLIGFFVLGGGAVQLRAQRAPVTVQTEIVTRNTGSKQEQAKQAGDPSNVVVWLTPLQSPGALRLPGNLPKLMQRNKAFEPHVLAIQAGSSIEFPNRDPFFHNVFSLFDGKRFDLGLYEAGTSKTARFDRVGVSFLFCNIHAGMSAVVVAVDTPYFALSDRDGRVNIPGVPDGRYRLHVWYERSLPEDLQTLERDVEISSSARALGSIRVMLNPNWNLAHKNKYGQDYVSPPSAGYTNP